MRKDLYSAIRSYLQGNIDKHVVNVKLHTENTVGVAEHSDYIETIEKELGIISEYEDKLQVLDKYFSNENLKSHLLND